MTLLARIEEALALCEKQRPGTHGGRTCEGANMNERATLRALKVAVEGLTAIADSAPKSTSLVVLHTPATNTLYAIERELTGGGE
jgi:hypothetical protein